VYDFIAKPGRRIDRRKQVDPAGRISGFLTQFAERGITCIFAPIDGPSRYLPDFRANRVTVLADQHQALAVVERGDGYRVTMLDHVDAMRRIVAISNFVDANVENAAFERATRRNDRNGIVHRHAVGGTATPCLVGRRVKPPRSSILMEFAWLAYFLAVFAISVYAMVLFVVPHHFNDKIAIALAGIFAALVMIATRAAFARRSSAP
jgi:hypothetical protein